MHSQWKKVILWNANNDKCKTDNTLAKLTERIREKTPINTTGDEQGDIKIDTTEIKEGHYGLIWKPIV